MTKKQRLFLRNLDGQKMLSVPSAMVEKSLNFLTDDTNVDNASIDSRIFLVLISLTTEFLLTKPFF
jgi:hypothetical protein